MKEITFNELPKAMNEVLMELRMLRTTVNQLMCGQTAADGGSLLILSVFKPGEVIRMNDPRLWEGENAPFKSYYAVVGAKAKGCPFRRPMNGGPIRIKAEELDAWINPQLELKKKYNI